MGARESLQSASPAISGCGAVWPDEPESSGNESLKPESAEEAAMWRQVLSRDGSAGFLYAVRTTGIYCRPSCASRRPARANVRFFADAEAARAAGFRPCRRCRPESRPEQAALVERLSAYLDEQLDRAVPLEELARIAGRAPATVQRLFTRVLGLSPRAWANARRAEQYRELLTQPQTRITDAIYDAGFSGPSRAHQAVSLGMAARRYRAQGVGEQIGYALAPAPAAFGRLLVAATARGVCAVLLGDDDATLTAELTRRFPRAALAPSPELQPYVKGVLAQLAEHPSAHALPLDLRGTAFQARVWAALRQIPRGRTLSYGQLAAAIGSPRSVRAVANACARNPAAILVPCHRIVGADGKLTGYRWGIERKRALLALETGEPTR